MKNTKLNKIVGLLVIVALALVMQAPAQGNPNFNQVQKTVSVTGYMMGAGAGVCMAVTLGACSVPAAVMGAGALLLGGISTASGFSPQPPDWRIPTAEPSQMPDYCGMDCQDVNDLPFLSE